MFVYLSFSPSRKNCVDRRTFAFDLRAQEGVEKNSLTPCFQNNGLVTREKKSASIGASEVKLEITTDLSTNRQTDMRAFREVSLLKRPNNCRL